MSLDDLADIKGKLDLYNNIRFRKEEKNIDNYEVVRKFLNDWYDVERYCMDKEESK